MAERLNEEVILIGGPSFHVDLSTLDACHPLHYSRRLLIFPCTLPSQRQSQLNALRVGLEALVIRCPLLGGKIAPLPADEASEGKPEWRTVIPHHGLELLAKDLHDFMPSFEDLRKANFPADAFPYELLMLVPADLTLEEEYPSCKVQFSAIEGGSIITFAMSHSVADGTGTDELMRLLAEDTRLAQEQSEGAVLQAARAASTKSYLGQDRSFLRNIKSNVPFNISDHPAYMYRNSVDNMLPELHAFESKNPEIPVNIRIPPNNLLRLKSDASTPYGLRISTHDAICALMWRSALLIRSQRSPEARSIPPSTITELFMPSDARRHLDLPLSYIGNAVYQLTASLQIGTLLSDSGLQEAAAAVRRAINAVTPDIASSYLASIRKVDARPLDWQFMKPNAWVTGLAMGTCLASGEVIYGADWGEAFGAVAAFRLVSEAGNNCVMPRLLDGSVEVTLSVLPEEVEMLKSIECFGRYVQT